MSELYFKDRIEETIRRVLTDELVYAYSSTQDFVEDLTQTLMDALEQCSRDRALELMRAAGMEDTSIDAEMGDK